MLFDLLFGFASEQKDWKTDSGAKYYLKIELQNMANTSDADFWYISFSAFKKTAVRLSKKGTLVDLGCGPGLVATRFIQEFGFKRLVAVDFSKPMLSIATEIVKNNTDGVDLILQEADLETSRVRALAKSAELVISCRVLVYMKSIENIFKEAARILKKGGYFGFNCYTHKTPHIVTHYCEYANFPLPLYAHSQAFLKTLFKKYGFKLLKRDSAPPDERYASIPIRSVAFFLRKI